VKSSTSVKTRMVVDLEGSANLSFKQKHKKYLSTRHYNGHTKVI